MSSSARMSSRKGWLVSYLGGVIAIAFCVVPFFVATVWYLNLTDINTTDYVPDPFWMSALAGAIGSLILAFLIVSPCWLWARCLSVKRTQ